MLSSPESGSDTEFTFQYGYIQMTEQKYMAIAINKFTFQYGYIQILSSF